MTPKMRGQSLLLMRPGPSTSYHPSSAVAKILATLDTNPPAACCPSWLPLTSQPTEIRHYLSSRAHHDCLSQQVRRGGPGRIRTYNQGIMSPLMLLQYGSPYYTRIHIGDRNRRSGVQRDTPHSTGLHRQGCHGAVTTHTNPTWGQAPADVITIGPSSPSEAAAAAERHASANTPAACMSSFGITCE